MIKMLMMMQLTNLFQFDWQHQPLQSETKDDLIRCHHSLGRRTQRGSRQWFHHAPSGGWNCSGLRLTFLIIFPPVESFLSSSIIVFIQSWKWFRPVGIQWHSCRRWSVAQNQSNKVTTTFPDPFTTDWHLTTTTLQSWPDSFTSRGQWRDSDSTSSRILDTTQHPPHSIPR